ncbi:hypothetical protein ACY2DA_13185 [Staphylococcus simulans]
MDNILCGNLEDSSKLNGVDNFEVFDSYSFFKDKLLVIEKVIVDSHIKLQVRIVEDNTNYDNDDKNVNAGKVVSLLVSDKLTNRLNIVGIVGNKVTLPDNKFSKAKIGNDNSLEVEIDDININEKPQGFEQSQNITKAEYKLTKLSQFKSFDVKRFLNSYEMEILTVYPQLPTIARCVVVITADNTNDHEISNVGKVFSIKVELEKNRDIPLELIAGRHQLKERNLQGEISGVIVKHNQVLLNADNLNIDVNGTNYSLGHSRSEQKVNKHLKHNDNKHFNHFSKKHF